MNQAYKKFQSEVFALNLGNFTDKPFETDGSGTVTVKFEKVESGSYEIVPSFEGQCSSEFAAAVCYRCKMVQKMINALTS